MCAVGGVGAVADDVLGVRVNLVPLLEWLDVDGTHRLAVGEQLLHEMAADESAGAGHDDVIEFPPDSQAQLHVAEQPRTSPLLGRRP